MRKHSEITIIFNDGNGHRMHFEDVPFYNTQSPGVFIVVHDAIEGEEHRTIIPLHTIAHIKVRTWKED